MHEIRVNGYMDGSILTANKHWISFLIFRRSQLCINTAIVYMHRFYAFHSFTHFHRNSIAQAALFLAAKVILAAKYKPPELGFDRRLVFLILGGRAATQIGTCDKGGTLVSQYGATWPVQGGISRAGPRPSLQWECALTDLGVRCCHRSSTHACRQNVQSCQR